MENHYLRSECGCPESDQSNERYILHCRRDSKYFLKASIVKKMGSNINETIGYSDCDYRNHKYTQTNKYVSGSQRDTANIY